MGRLTHLFLSALLALVLFSGLAAQNGPETKGYEITIVQDIPHSPVKDQYRSGTCWAFAGLSLLEAEMIRMKKPEVNLSEMFIVWHSYAAKATKHVRLHGHLNFSAGGAFHDVTNVIRKHGIVPEQVYTGLKYGEDKHVHGELDRVLHEQVNAVIENRNKKLSTAWHEAVKATLNSYLGELPGVFNYGGREYTAQSFARDYVGLNMDDYVELTSFTHHPFYSKFILEVPDNWSWDEMYNVPMDELEEIIDHALANGFTVAWAADVSEKGFATSSKGVAVVPEIDFETMDNTEIARWEELSEKEKYDRLYELSAPGKEKVITQEMRQVGFDNYETTDDHGMLIVGTGKDQNGTFYYRVKNSWGNYNDHQGYFYASRPYVRYKTMCIMVHKDAIPKNIRKKLNL